MHSGNIEVKATLSFNMKTWSMNISLMSRDDDD